MMNFKSFSRLPIRNKNSGHHDVCQHRSAIAYKCGIRDL
jgi:hypothetical protein